MAFQTVPINIAGPSYQSRSRALSSQATINFYQELDDSGKEQFVLHSFPGQNLFGSVTANIDRGQHVMSEVLYRISGTTLYEVKSTGVHTNRGTIDKADRCIMADDGEKMYIVNSGTVHEYNSTTKALTLVTDPDIVGAIAVDYINSQFVYTLPDQLFIISDVKDGSSASGLNGAQAEAQPDDLIRAYVFNQVVYMLGSKSTEPWWNNGTGLPPFLRIDPQIFNVGLAGLHAVAHNDAFMYWLGDDRQVYRTSGGGNFQRVSSKGVAHAIEGYTVVDDAVAWTMTLEGQNFFVLQFPTENKTWIVNESLGDKGWYELSAGITGGRYNAASHSWVYGKHLVSHETAGTLLELDLEAFTNNGETIKRTRVMGSIDGNKIGHRGKRIQMSRFELIMEMGVGLLSGQGEDPKIMIEASYDGGESFGAGTWMRIGRLGETNIRAEWWDTSSFYDLIIRITTSDPVKYTIMAGAIDLRLAGR